jgi:hypothetical protein
MEWEKSLARTEADRNVAIKLLLATPVRKIPTGKADVSRLL